MLKDDKTGRLPRITAHALLNPRPSQIDSASRAINSISNFTTVYGQQLIQGGYENFHRRQVY
jgi:hypothetical protein